MQYYLIFHWQVSNSNIATLHNIKFANCKRAFVTLQITLHNISLANNLQKGNNGGSYMYQYGQ